MIPIAKSSFLLLLIVLALFIGITSFNFEKIKARMDLCEQNCQLLKGELLKLEGWKLCTNPSGSEVCWYKYDDKGDLLVKYTCMKDVNR